MEAEKQTLEFAKKLDEQNLNLDDSTDPTDSKNEFKVKSYLLKIEQEQNDLKSTVQNLHRLMEAQTKIIEEERARKMALILLIGVSFGTRLS